MTSAPADVIAEGRASAPFEISRRRWRRLLSELERRGQGSRESGAFLLAGRDCAPIGWCVSRTTTTWTRIA